MAVDTKAKRMSSIMVGLPFRRVFPDPDGVIDAPDRQTNAKQYNGISVGSIVASTKVPYVGFVVNILRPMGSW